MKKFNIPNINTSSYWDKSQTAFDYGLRQQIYSQIAGVGNRIIELGCGLSPFLHVANFKEKWGVDFSPETIIRAKELYPEVSYVLADVTNTFLGDKLFDVSVAGEVIEHLPVPEDLIAEMVRITRRTIIISTPNLEFDDPEHLWEFSEDDLMALLSPYGDTTCNTVESERFPGRKYIFAVCNLFI